MPNSSMQLTDRPTIPGLSLRRPLRGSGDGPPWLAVELATGHVVVVRRASGALTATDLPRHPHLLVAQPVLDEAGEAWTTSAYATQGGLDQVEPGRRLLPGEVVTVGVAVARALASLHQRGLRHGAVRASSVVVDVEGRPLLDAAAIRPGAATSDEAVADLAALGALLIELAEEPLPERLGALLRQAANADRIETALGAADLGRELMFACSPRPLTLPVAGAPGEPRPARDPRWRKLTPERLRGLSLRPLLLRGVLVAVGLAVAVALGLLWSHLADAPQASAVGDRRGTLPVAPVADEPIPPPGGRWQGILTGLDQARAEAFELADPAKLGAVDASGSPALARDGEAVAALINQRVRPRGQTWSVLKVQTLYSGTGRVVLAVTDRASSYQLVHLDGRLAAEHAARGPSRWRVDLQWSGGRWLFANTSRIG